jgi:hypothetical protein
MVLEMGQLLVTTVVVMAVAVVAAEVLQVGLTALPMQVLGAVLEAILVLAVRVDKIIMTHPEMVRVVVEVVGAFLRLKNPVVEVVSGYMDREPVVMLERTIVTG